MNSSQFEGKKTQNHIRNWKCVVIWATLGTTTPLGAAPSRVSKWNMTNCEKNAVFCAGRQTYTDTHTHACAQILMTAPNRSTENHKWGNYIKITKGKAKPSHPVIFDTCIETLYTFNTHRVTDIIHIFASVAFCYSFPIPFLFSSRSHLLYHAQWAR